MANPFVPQGVMNRLKASLVIPDLPQLNVTAPYLSNEGIGLAFEGDITTIIPTMTGTITSPEPYQMATIMPRLLRTQQLADLYKQQLETTSLLGDITVYPDTTTGGLSPFVIYNCAILTVGELTFNGMSAGYGVSIKGYYPTNSALFD